MQCNASIKYWKDCLHFFIVQAAKVALIICCFSPLNKSNVHFHLIFQQTSETTVVPIIVVSICIEKASILHFSKNFVSSTFIRLIKMVLFRCIISNFIQYGVNIQWIPKRKF